jgi:hypothetical protein
VKAATRESPPARDEVGRWDAYVNS